jgi:hypothetical protein
LLQQEERGKTGNMPKFVPITDSERPKSEQSFYSDEFMQHRLFENPDAVIRSTEESLLNEKDEVAQHIRHAEGENKMVKNEKGLWVRAKTVDVDSKAHSGKGMGRGNRGISILDKYAEDQRRESEAHQIPSSSQFEDVDERSNKKERRSPSTEKRSERDRRSRDDSRESRRNAKRSRSRSHSPRQKRDRSRDRDRDRSPKHKKKRDRRDSRSRSRSRERRHKDRKRSRSPEYRRKDKYDSDRERESDREDRLSKKKSRHDDDRDRRRDKHQHESRRKYSSDEEEEEDKYKHRKNDAHKESHRKNNKDRKEDQQDDDRDMVKISSHSTASHPPQRETSPPRRDDTKPLQETKQQQQQQQQDDDDDDLPPIQITAVQILNHFHEVFAMKSNRRLDSLLELFHPDAKIQNLKTGNSYLSSLSAIKEAFQRTNPHEIIVSKRIYFEHSSFIHERNQELITYACDLHRAGTSPGLGDLSKDTILFYECCNQQILSIWGMNDVEQFAQNENLTEDQIYFSKLWPCLEKILQEKWGKLLEMKKIDLMEISHFHNYDKMEVWG